MTLNAPQFTESLCHDISSLDWLRVRFLTNVAGMRSALTGSREGQERLPGTGTAAPKGGKSNHKSVKTWLPLHLNSVRELQRGCFIKLWGLRKTSSPILVWDQLRAIFTDTRTFSPLNGAHRNGESHRCRQMCVFLPLSYTPHMPAHHNPEGHLSV